VGRNATSGYLPAKAAQIRRSRERQAEALRLHAKGRPVYYIAYVLDVKPNTVRRYLKEGK
jgi:DNA-binding NarL/FixJ family response regulator